MLERPTEDDMVVGVSWLELHGEARFTTSGIAEPHVLEQLRELRMRLVVFGIRGDLAVRFGNGLLPLALVEQLARRTRDRRRHRARNGQH